MGLLLNMVRQTVSAVASSGVGALTLSTAATGYETFAAAGAVDGYPYSYAIQEGIKWEVGRGVISSSGTVLTRSGIIKSSAGVATAETFTTNAVVICTELKEDFAPDPFIALTDATTIAWDMNLSLNAKVTLGGNRTMGQPTNLKEGASGAFCPKQDGTGNRTLAWAACWDFLENGVPTLSTGANKEDYVSWQCVDATTPRIVASFKKSA